MKSNRRFLAIMLVLFVIFLTGCNGSRYSQGDSGDRRAYHNHGVNNRSYRGY